MPLKTFEKHRLSQEWQYAIKDFDCCSSKVGNFEKINSFLKEESLKYSQDNLSRTTIFIKDGVCIAFYSLAMGSIEKSKGTAEDYKPLRDYPALFLTHLAVDKSYQHKGIAKAIINYIIKQAYEDKEIAARFIFLDAYRESVSWYIRNPLFEIMYTPLSERIVNYCEKKFIGTLNERLKDGHTIECELDQDQNTDISLIKKNCETVLTKHVDDIFQEFAPENSLFKVCGSKVKLHFEENRPNIKLESFTSRNNLSIIRKWLENKDNILNIDVTIPLYADINKYYKAICDS